jgi:hypothetical protein
LKKKKKKKKKKFLESMAEHADNNSEFETATFSLG